MIALSILTLGLFQAPAADAHHKNKYLTADGQLKKKYRNNKRIRRLYKRYKAARAKRRNARRYASKRRYSKKRRAAARISRKQALRKGKFIRSTQRVSVAAYRGKVRRRAPGTVLTGMASYYWQPQPVASGGRFNPNALTAAHKTLPFGTRVRVKNLNNGRTVTVTINDRGPYIRGRIIDLSKRAATIVGMRKSGIAPVTVTVLR